MNFYKILPAIALATTAISCQDKQENNSEVKYAAASTQQILGTIEKGSVIVAANSSLSTVKTAISEQLRFITGILNRFKGGMNHGGIQIENVKLESTNSEENTQTYTYTAELVIAWPKGEYTPEVPEVFEVPLPHRADKKGLALFDSLYGKNPDCVSKLNHKTSPDSYWFYYNPAPYGYWCNAGKNATENIANIKINMQKKNSEKVSYPEYQKIWEDGKFISTVLFAELGEGSFGWQDGGLGQFKEAVRRIERAYGTPDKVSNEKVYNAILSNDNSVKIKSLILDYTVEVNGEKKPAQFNFFFVSGHLNYTMYDRAFTKQFKKLTKISDHVMVNSHSDYGKNIENFYKLGEFQAGQYQIFHVNACDSLSGTGKQETSSLLLDRHAEANKSLQNPNSYADLIVNAMPALSHEVASVVTSTIGGLLAGELSYEEIFAQEDHPKSQSSVVLNDEDNAFQPK